ncbi:MAG TPA: site-2 protease family protein, partial [Vicinamibacteria bacterium]
ATVRGIPIAISPSWLIVFALVLWSFAASYYPARYPGWTTRAYYAAGLATALLFFAAIVVHELGHALAAARFGIRTRRITLWPLGGLAELEREPARPAQEFAVALAGPATSLLLGALCLGLAALVAPLSAPLGGIAAYLGMTNLALGLFNLIPGFPLDGGRVLRALLWWLRGDAVQAARWAARVGQVVAVGLIFVGLLESFAGAGLSALWLVFVGWFLLGAAENSAEQIAADDHLRGLRVADVMSRDCARVEAGISLRDFVIHYLMRTGRRCFLVTQGERVVGLLTPEELKHGDRARWAQTPVGAVMRPLEELTIVSPDDPASECLASMTNSGGHALPLPVVQDGRLQGVLSRGDIVRVLRARAELST